MNSIDLLGQKLGNAALTTLVRLCPEIETASLAQQEAACAAMRAKAKETVDQLLADAEDAPGVTHAAFACAALSLAQEGVKVLRGG